MKCWIGLEGLFAWGFVLELLSSLPLLLLVVAVCVCVCWYCFFLGFVSLIKERNERRESFRFFLLHFQFVDFYIGTLPSMARPFFFSFVFISSFSFSLFPTSYIHLSLSLFHAFSTSLFSLILVVRIFISQK